MTSGSIHYPDKQKTDIVIPLGKGSVWGNNELKYSLRSVEKYLSGYGRVFIIGHLPAWCTNVIHVKATDKTGIPASYNILEKVKLACQERELSENFLFMNDDHYLLKSFQADTFPNYYHQTLAQFLKTRKGDPYAKMCKETDKYLKLKNCSTLFYDIHYPILYNKTAFLDVFKSVDLKNRNGYVIKSLYGNMMNLQGTEQPDCKFGKLPGKDDLVFSTTPRVSATIASFLQEQFPNQGKYEKPEAWRYLDRF